MKRPCSFDDKLEALIADATREQLQRIRDLASLQMRIVDRQVEGEAKRAAKEVAQ